MKLLLGITVIGFAGQLCFADEVMTRILVNSGKNGHVCAEGLRYVPGYGCEDIDECMEMVPCKLGQTCRNVWGNYTCLCSRGFKINSAGECIDRDECAMGYCGEGQKCVNTVGSFECDCSAGSKKVGRFCRDINECMDKPCADNQYCINTRGSYRCECKAGYADSRDGSCHDVDECAQAMCGALGEMCANTIGSYKCVCRDGYQKDEMTNGRYCKDVDECQNSTTCPEYSECYNLQGSFLCRCHRGFNLVNGHCLDKTECTSGEGQRCQWRCLDLPGSYQCQCPEGYEKIGFNCVDINECDRKMTACSDDETCVNTQGGYECVQPPNCPVRDDGSSIYRKVMKTDEFGYRQVGNISHADLVTTNICRRQRCGKMADEDVMTVKECKAEPLSISYHYVAVPSGIPTNRALLHVSYSARRRRQQYNFNIVSGNEDGMFKLKQPSLYHPRAKLVVAGKLMGPSTHVVKIDMSTYHPNGKMRDSRMLTVTIYVSMYDF